MTWTLTPERWAQLEGDLRPFVFTRTDESGAVLVKCERNLRCFDYVQSVIEGSGKEASLLDILF